MGCHSSQMINVAILLRCASVSCAVDLDPNLVAALPGHIAPGFRFRIEAGSAVVVHGQPKRPKKTPRCASA